MNKRRYWTGARNAPAQNRFFVNALDPDLWREGDEVNWDTCWHTGMPAPSVFQHVTPGKTINHIPGNNALTVKSLLHATLITALRAAPHQTMRDRLSFFPNSFLMPDDYQALQAEAFREPDKKWIAKPKRLSRGRGIQLFSDAGAVPLDPKWLVQEYLSDPHLYDGHKYVLRCYVLIASIDPLRVYLYKDGFVKLASEPFSGAEDDNLYAHLTNPDVNEHNTNADASVVFYSFNEYRDWLKRQAHDAKLLFRRIRDIAILCVIAAREHMRRRTISSRADQAGCYELIGMDCMVDSQLKPWLLECNLSPSLDVFAAPEAGGDHEAKTKQAIVRDLVSVIGLNEPKLDRFDATAEHKRAGRFERVYPAHDAEEFLPFFPVPRYADMALAQDIAKTTLEFSLEPNESQEFVFDDELAIYSTRTSKFYAPPSVASYIWMKAADGASPDAIAKELILLTGADSHEHANAEHQAAEIKKEVWDALSEWAADGLLRARNADSFSPIEYKRNSVAESCNEEWIFWSGKLLRLCYGAVEIRPRLDPLIAPFRCDALEGGKLIQILCDAAGYSVATSTHSLRSKLKLSEIAGALREILLSEYAKGEPGRICLNASLCTIAESGLVAFGSTPEGGWDELALCFAASPGGRFHGGASALTAAPGQAATLAAPARIAKQNAQIIGISKMVQNNHITHEWPGCRRGYFIPCKDEVDNGLIASVSAVVIPKRESRTSTTVQLMSGREGLLALNALRQKNDATFGESTAQQLFEWRRAIEIYEVKYSDPSDAARAVRAILGANF